VISMRDLEDPPVYATWKVLRYCLGNHNSNISLSRSPRELPDLFLRELNGDLEADYGVSMSL
jgi:hypothetical protein